ncbi:SDR family oxidoreductase [Halalkalicoccus jeotgali]|uniref:dTDP-4-dehydrorhamnose reductase n=1 Tax=Halalkalicoccus jeotgali (strain DSM 18796 / CECT 7217 / JCM 14584 / KCTC 4019 / B3) TaxID=795797 RepID=D8J2F8_HALJB|nr:NAD(P)-dependent oxidoreductase [Halalkalicoccus jeotgali]ADJ14915.1 dTDP-4-dehydrorhamnose reductase [Halalkalicoccus jeotgali B3]ELY35069.1 dTDP-4-dehydrorhamnose reductase [Halalkalicoccus jeotgali B3]
MTSLLVTGASGLLGRCLLDAEWSGGRVVGTYYTTPIESGHETVHLDVRDGEAVARLVERVDPDVVIHSAAATSVEACEDDPKLAHGTNARGTKHVVDAATAVGARVIYPSTAYVFGDGGPVHAEDDEPAPMNRYGRSKLDGERYVQAASPENTIVRFCVVVNLGPADSPDFGSWVRGRLESGERVRLIDDQEITPTVLSDAIDALGYLVEHETAGVFHVASPDRLTRYELGVEIARRHGLDPDLLEAIPIAEMDWQAPRPDHLCLGAEKLSQYGYQTTRIRTE